MGSSGSRIREVLTVTCVYVGYKFHGTKYIAINQTPVFSNKRVNAGNEPIPARQIIRWPLCSGGFGLAFAFLLASPAIFTTLLTGSVVFIVLLTV
ncbi:MAG: hypothetical protein WCI54_18195 [Bacteroidia bacterium]